MTKTLFLASAAAILATGASAADLPRRAPPPAMIAPLPLFTWTGFFAGFDSAYTMTDRQRITTLGNAPGNVTNVNLGRRPGTTSTQTDAYAKLGGGVGYNYQFTPGSGFVAGVAANATWTDVNKNSFVLGTGNVPGGPPNPSHFRQNLDWLGTATGRLGYAFDRVLVYGTGGFAFGNVRYAADFYTPAPTFGVQFRGRFNDIETGYVYGGGIEYAIPEDSFLTYLSLGRYLGIRSQAVTLKVEYLHYDLGSRNVQVGLTGLAGGAGSYTTKFRTEGDIIKAGFNYKFGGF